MVYNHIYLYIYISPPKNTKHCNIPNELLLAFLQNVLENLQMHFEDEKAALLSALHQHTDATERERERQRALVKLQRERQQLQVEDKLDSAALIFSMGQQHLADRQERFVPLGRG